MSSYVLLCVAQTGTTDLDSDGEFLSKTWASPGNTTTMPDPNTAALTGVKDGDTIAFAIQIQDGNGATGPTQLGQLDWVSVSVSAVTQAGNRNVRFADNDSPFRIGTGTRPNTMLLAAKTGTPGGMQDYDQNGNPVSGGTGAFRGTPMFTVFRDLPRGKTAPNRATSQYEAVIGCSLTDSGGQTWQFTFDPEVDVDNGN